MLLNKITFKSQKTTRASIASTVVSLNGEKPKQTFFPKDDEYLLNFGVADWIVFGSTIIISLGIGVYYALTAKKINQTTEGYLMGNRNLNLFPVAFSLVVSYESSIMMLGYAAEVYIYGIMLCIRMIPFTLTMMLSARIAVPIMHPLKIASVYEYLDLKYKHKAPRLLATISGILFYVVYMGINLFGPALALKAGFPTWASIVAVAAVAIVYTTIGGIKAVIWTDVFQFLVLTSGIVAVIIGTYAVAGGAEKVWKINDENMRLNFFDFNPDPSIRHTFWGLVFGGMFRSYGMIFNQATVQRINCVATQGQGVIIMLFSIPIFTVTVVAVLMESIGIFAYFNTIRCDPLSSGQISNPNQILPFLILRLFRNYPGVSGLYIAALFSAALSTLSSGLSSISTQTAHDFVIPFFKSYSDKKTTTIAKIAVACFGSMSVAIAFLIAEMEGSFAQISGVLLTTISAPIGGLFLYSIFCPWANLKGAMGGFIASSALIFWIALGQTFSTTLVTQPWLPSNQVDKCPNSPNITFANNITIEEQYWQEMDSYYKWKPQGFDKIYAVSYTLFGVLGISNVIIVGSIISFLTGTPKAETVDTRYMLSIGETFFPFLPRKIKKRMEFGLNFKKREEWLKRNERNQFELVVEEKSELDT